MSEKSYLFKFPGVRTVRTVVGETVDKTTNTVVPVYEATRVSVLLGLVLAFRQTGVLQQAKFDLFDVQDFRKELQGKLDKRERREFDDTYLVVTETQKRMIEVAVKSYDWTMPTVNMGVVEATTIWIDWFDMFDAIRNPVEFNANKLDADYATWMLARDKRVADEAAEDEKARTEALTAAAAKTSEAQASSEPVPVAVPVAVEQLASEQPEVAA